MPHRTRKDEWNEYKERELSALIPILKKYGYTLEDDQPHIKGERFLMQAVTTSSGKKLILLGRRESDNLRVVIKGTSDKNGRNEIEHERKCRTLLHKINFAYGTFFSPEEIAYISENEFVISIQKFIEQPCPFLKRPIKEQFEYSLRAFKAEESTHATTRKHLKLIRKAFDSKHANDYINAYKMFKKEILSGTKENKKYTALLNKTEKTLQKNKKTIEQYCGFLTHTDFVPHNFRIQHDTIYLLDYSSLRFGNKHESWARFINFMTLYNLGLAQSLETYIKDNRAKEEQSSLRLMRMYRLIELLCYYTRTLKNSESDLYVLNKERISFWASILESVYQNRRVDTKIIEQYILKRDHLRSADEKERQKDLH